VGFEPEDGELEWIARYEVASLNIFNFAPCLNIFRFTSRLHVQKTPSQRHQSRKRRMTASCLGSHIFYYYQAINTRTNWNLWRTENSRSYLGQCYVNTRARLVGRIPSNRPEMQKSTDWMPFRGLCSGWHAAQSTSSPGPLDPPVSTLRCRHEHYTGK
jgi:hypothetical protein